jgi:hypothetical protein
MICLLYLLENPLKPARESFLFFFAVWSGEGQILRKLSGGITAMELNSMFTVAVHTEAAREFMKNEINKVWVRLPDTRICKRLLREQDIRWILSHGDLEQYFDVARGDYVCKMETYYGKLKRALP